MPRQPHPRPGRPATRARAVALVLTAVVLTAPVLAAPRGAAAQPLVPRQLEAVFTDVALVQPTALTHAGDGSDRLFAVERPGRIRIVRGAPAPGQLFLDLTDRVNSSPGEGGLLSVAFHPSFAANGRLFVNYTRASLVTRVAELRVDAADPHAVDPASERVVLEVDQPYGNHNGGQLAFGPDGMLYVGLGDGGSGGDPHGHGQDRSTLLGTILRLDVDAPPDPGLGYAIPADNPFVGNAEGWRPEIWAWGLRNPWRFAFDRVTGDLWAGDVGQNRQEEIDLIVRGANYGWNVMEGFECFAASTCDRQGLALPVLQYGRAAGVSVTGGAVYRGQRLGDLYGAYVYGDFGSRHIWAVRRVDGALADSARIATNPAGISAFGQDEAGELYVVGYDGSLRHFLPMPGEAPVPTAVTEPAGAAPAGVALGDAFPNPFNPAVTLPYTLAAAGPVRLQVYDVLGRRVRSLVAGVQPAGAHRVGWDGRDDAGRAAGAGVYLVRLESGGAARVQRLVKLD